MAEDAPTGTAVESTGRHRAGRSAGVTGPAGRTTGATGRTTGPVGRRARSTRGLRLTAVLGLGIGLLVLAIPAGATVLRPYLWGGDSGPEAVVPVAAASPPPAPATPPDEAGPTPSGTPEGSPPPTTTPVPPRATNAPGATPPARPVPTRTAVPGATPTLGPGGTSKPPAAELPPPPPEPVLLGPDGRDELARMVDRYCERHVGGASWPDSRGDGRWECERLLLSSRTVDMDTACRDTYGDGAFARNDTGDAFDWRCFRR